MNPSDVKAGPKPFVFVLMPFKKPFDPVYQVIKDVASAAGAYAQRVDEQQYREGIFERIINQISKADVIVADMTGENANVFYEVGYAHALNKIVIPLTQDVEDIPFDLRNRPHVVYGTTMELEERLRPWLTWAIAESRKSSGYSVVCPIEVYVNNIRVAAVGPDPATIVQDLGRFIPPNALTVLFRNVSGSRDPIEHVYVLFEPEALVKPFEMADEYVIPSEPVYVHPKPDVDRFTHRYRVREKAFKVPPFGYSSMDVHLCLANDKRGFPAGYHLPMMLEVLTAGSAFRFRLTVLFLKSSAQK